MREAVKLGLREAVGLGVRLMLFALVAGLLLAVVNAVTEGPIAQNERLKADGARIAVIGDYAFEAGGTDTSGYDAIRGVYAALDGDGQTVGYVYELASRGYGGDVVLSVGIRDGAVSGVAIASHSETKGLGTADEAPFLQRFLGLTQAGEAESVDAMGGATVSSDAVRGAVAQALAHAHGVLGAGGEG